ASKEFLAFVWANTGASVRPMFWRGSSVSVLEDESVLDPSATMKADAERGGRVSRKESMTRPRYQEGCLWTRGKRKKGWVLRWREDVLQPDGSVKRMLRAGTLGPVNKITRQQARNFLQEKVGPLNLGIRRPQATMTLADFVQADWRPNAGLALKRSSVRYYE